MKILALLFALLVCAHARATESIGLLDRAAAARLADATAQTAPTIVALWSSDCVHCKKNLALFARLASSDRKLKLVTVAVQPAVPELAGALDRLAVPGARFAYGGDAPEALGYALDPRWRGELPRTLLFDGRGGRVALSGVLDQARVQEALGRGPR